MAASEFSTGRIRLMLLVVTTLWGCDGRGLDAPPDESSDSGPTLVQAREAEAFAATMAALEGDEGAEWASLSLASTQEQWVPLGLNVEAGKGVTLFGFGVIQFDSVRIEPRHRAWIRIGRTGDLIPLASNQHTFEPEASGELYLTVPPFGMIWDSPAGEFPDDMSAWPSLPIDLHFVAVQWTDPPGQGLDRLSMADNDVFALARQRIDNPKTLPAGFSYLWFLGQAEVFDGFADGDRSGVHAFADNDYGIIKRAVDLPLTANTEIEFDWLYSTLPSHGPETDAAFHDYLSVAVEFDNGQDITWLWSSSLEPEQGFACPLAWWDERETHIVLQSGPEGLGEWFSHKRNVLADYSAHVSGEAPERIVGVWFIAVSLSTTPADAKFANVALRGDGSELTILESER